MLSVHAGFTLWQLSPRLFYFTLNYSWKVRIACLLTGRDPLDIIDERVRLDFHTWGAATMSDRMWTTFLEHLSTEEFIHLMLVSDRGEDEGDEGLTPHAPAAGTELSAPPAPAAHDS